MVISTVCPAAPAARGWSLRLWWSAIRDRAECHASLRDLPEHLRADVGLDGGLPLSHFENGGRVFITRGHPDATLSGWHW